MSLKKNTFTRMVNNINKYIKNITINRMFLTTVFHLGTPAFDKILLITGNTRLESGIKKLSPDTQTSCLEG